MPASAIREFEDRYGVPIVEGYGQSEGTVVTTANPVRGMHKPGTVGLPLPGQEVRVVGDDDEPLASGQDRRGDSAGPQRCAGVPRQARGDRPDVAWRLVAQRRPQPV